ncbi:MAG: class E sortase [Actinomycetota bacterium]|nr:class E sortase [Actinomycetota bacterium]
MATTTDDFTGSDPVAVPDEGGYQPPPRRRHRRPAHASWKPPLGPVRKTIREIGFNLITAGIIVLLFVVYQLWGTGFAEASSQSKLKHQFHEPPAAPAPTVPASDSPTLGAPDAAIPGAPEGTAIAHLRIPKLGVDKYVVEGISEEALKQGPGHYPGTPLPGEPGNSAIAGHRTTYGAPFYSLNEVAPGDDIFITTGKGAFHYTVDHSEVVKPTDVGVIGPTPDNRLTLTTCNPRFSATTRLIVVAKLTDLPVAPPKTIAPPVAAVKAITLGNGDHSAWPATLLYGLIFVVLWLGVRLWSARRRYWKWIPFLAGIPVCLVPLWFLFENAIRLLPQNI